MINKELQAYRTYQSFMRIMLTISGCWYMPTKAGKLTYYWLVCAFLLMILYATINVYVHYVYRHTLKLNAQTVTTMSVTITSFGSILKVGTFLFNYNTLINFHRTLSHLFEEELARNKKTQIIMLSTLRKTTTLMYTYAIVNTSVIVMILMFTFLFLIHDLCHFRLPTNYTLLFTSENGYFWSVPNNSLYHFHVLLEVILGCMSSIITISVDSAFGFYVYYFTSTMRALTFRLTSPLPNEKFSDLLKTFVGKHQILLRCRDTLEHVYGNIILWHMITNSVILCAVLYRTLPFSDFNIPKISEFITFATMELLQAFIYTWYGTSLTNAGEDLREGIYFSEWPNSDLDSHVKTNIILIMMQKPITVNAVFASVNVRLFIHMMKTTMSYFILLKSFG